MKAVTVLGMFLQFRAVGGGWPAGCASMGGCALQYLYSAAAWPFNSGWPHTVQGVLSIGLCIRFPCTAASGPQSRGDALHCRVTSCTAGCGMSYAMHRCVLQVHWQPGLSWTARKLRGVFVREVLVRCRGTLVDLPCIAWGLQGDLLYCSRFVGGPHALQGGTARTGSLCTAGGWRGMRVHSKGTAGDPCAL
jgi:hypothetical protein